MVVQFSHYVQVPVEAPPVPQTPVQSPLFGQVRQSRSSDSFSRCSSEVKFASGRQEGDATLKDIGKSLWKWGKRKGSQAKAAVKKELAKPGSEKKAAVVGGLVGFGVGEMATFGTTGGVAGATAASAAIGYLGAKAAKQSNANSQQPQTVEPIFRFETADSDDDDTAIHRRNS